MKFGSIWQRLRSSFANSAGTIIFGMKDDAKTVLIAGPPVPSPPPVAAVQVPPPGAANVPPPPPPPPSLPLFQDTVSAQMGDGFHSLAWSYSSVTEDAQRERSRDCGARPKPEKSGLLLKAKRTLSSVYEYTAQRHLDKRQEIRV